MSRGFYHVVLCAFAARENEGTLIVMVRACTQYIGDLGKIEATAHVESVAYSRK
jgi:hypothetical protein